MHDIYFNMILAKMMLKKINQINSFYVVRIYKKIQALDQSIASITCLCKYNIG